MELDLEPVAITPQKQDSAWKHCEIFKYGERVQLRCIYCEKMFKGGGITRVKEHLAGKKGQGPICDRVPPDVRLLLQQCLERTAKRHRKKRKSTSEPEPIAYAPPGDLDPSVDPSDVNNGFESVSPDPVAHNPSLFSSRTKQRTYRRGRKKIHDASANTDGGDKNVTEFDSKDMDNPIHLAICGVKNVRSSSKDKDKQIHMAIGRFLFDIGADFDAVKSVNFQPMIAAIVSGGQGISVPSHDDLRGWILRNSVEEMKKDIDECKLIWKRTGCSILVEQRNSEKGLTLLNFLVYSPEKVVFLKSVDASEILSSTIQLYELLKQVVEEVGAAHVVQVITKCEDNYISAGKKLMDAYPFLYWAPCAAHCIDRMLEDFGKLEWIREIIEQVQSVTRFIYNHSEVLNMMWRFTSGNDIVQPSITRSATNFATLECIVNLKLDLQAMVTSPEWNDSSFSKEAGGLAMLDTINDQAFWNSCTLITHLTDPLLRVLRIACSKKRPAMGYVYAGLYRAKEAIKKEFVKREDYIVYWKIIDSRWEQQKHLPLHAAGFFLNPMFFYNIDEEMRSEILSAVFDCIERLVPDVTIQDKIIKEINLYKNAVGVFGRNLAIRARDTMLPAEWWSTYGEGCLNLSRFAIRILSQTCSAIGCKTDQISIEQAHQATNCLEQQRLSDLAFVQYNMRLRRMVQENIDSSVDPLSYCNMDVLEDWVSKNRACLEEHGGSDWKSLEVAYGKMNLRASKDEAEDLGTGFDDAEIFKGYSE